MVEEREIIMALVLVQMMVILTFYASSRMLQNVYTPLRKKPNGYYLKLSSESAVTKTEYANIESPELPALNTYCLSFWYLIHNPYGTTGSIEVFQNHVVQGTLYSTSLFIKQSDKFTEWRKVTWKVSAVSHPSTLSILGTISIDKRVWVALDEIAITFCDKDTTFVTVTPSLKKLTGINVARNKYTAAKDGNISPQFVNFDTYVELSVG